MWALMSPCAPEPATCRLQTPDEVEILLRDPILRVARAVMKDAIAERAALDHLLRERDRRDAAVVVANHVHDARLPHRAQHRLAFRRRCARAASRTGRPCLPRRRRSQISRCVSLGVTMSTMSISGSAITLAPIGRPRSPSRDSPPPLRTAAALRPQIVFMSNVSRQIEEARRLPPGVRVRPAHEVVADHPDCKCASGRHRAGANREGRLYRSEPGAGSSQSGRHCEMKCPSCASTLTSAEPRCPRCKLTLQTLDIKFGALPKHAMYFTDRTDRVPFREMATMRRALELFHRRFPQCLFSVFVADLPRGTSVSEYAFWLANRARFSSVEHARGENFDLLLVVDVSGRAAALSAGYGLEEHLQEEDLQAACRCLRRRDAPRRHAGEACAPASIS